MQIGYIEECIDIAFFFISSLALTLSSVVMSATDLGM